MQGSTGRKQHALDAQIGERLRLRRTVLGFPLKSFSPQMGVTYQQMQKYEKGTNKLTAGQLFEVSQLLGVGVSYFFEDLDFSDLPMPRHEPESGVRLNALPFLVAYLKLTNSKHRKAIRQLVAALSDDERSTAPHVQQGMQVHLDS